MKHFVNVWMTLTNLAVVPVLLWNHNYIIKFVAAVAAMASMFMHITETKHTLPGFFTRYSGFALNLDRLCAILIGVYMVLNYYDRLDLIQIGFIGLLNMLLSEHKKTPLIVYVVSHTVWHLCVYRAFYLA